MPPPQWPPQTFIGDGADGDPGNDKDDGWLISFVDLLTLLLTLFVLLLALNHVATRTPPAAEARPVTLSMPPEIRDQVEVINRVDEADLMIKDDLLFDEGSTTLKPGGNALLDRLARVLSENDCAVSVEGHSDDLPIHTERFPSNWELSTARAAAVTRYFIERGIAPSRLSAAGFADTRPLTANDSAAARARNRRVSLVVHLRNGALQKGSHFGEQRVQ